MFADGDFRDHESTTVEATGPGLQGWSAVTWVTKSLGTGGAVVEAGALLRFTGSLQDLGSLDLVTRLLHVSLCW